MVTVVVPVSAVEDEPLTAGADGSASASLNSLRVLPTPGARLTG
jgi:hypothetical protein